MQEQMEPGSLHPDVTMEAIGATCDVMRSLQKPKKITIVGSDGQTYHFLAKPKDDLRKDMRLMEFFNLLNQLFRKDSAGKTRHLHIRTYVVVPLTDSCGLISWVTGTQGFRPILAGLYAQESPTFPYDQALVKARPIYESRQHHLGVQEFLGNPLLLPSF
mgnify:CR=1 FL=1